MPAVIAKKSELKASQVPRVDAIRTNTAANAMLVIRAST
jgi:hypothetical protein